MEILNIVHTFTGIVPFAISLDVVDSIIKSRGFQTHYSKNSSNVCIIHNDVSVYICYDGRIYVKTSEKSSENTPFIYHLECTVFEVTGLRIKLVYCNSRHLTVNNYKYSVNTILKPMQPRF